MRRIAVLVGIVLCAHILSYAYMAHRAAGNPDALPAPLLRGDAVEYAEFADSIIEQDGLTGSLFEVRRHWPPGYPLFLAFTKEISGKAGESGGWHLAIALQVLMALVAVVFLYKIACTFLPPSWALAPPLLYGVDPHAVLANTTTLSDGLGSSLLVIIVYLAFFFDARGRETLRWGSIGLLLGYLVLTRPITVLLIPLGVAALVAAVRQARRQHPLVFLAPLAAYTLGVLIFLAPWLAWTHAKFGVYEIAHVSAVNLLYYNVRDFLSWKEIHKSRPMPAVLVDRHRDAPEFSTIDAYLRARLESTTPPGGNMQNYELKLGVQLVLEDPLRYAVFHLAHLSRFFLSSGIEEYQETAWQVGADKGLFAPIPFMTLESMYKPLVARDWGASFAALQLFPVVLEMVAWGCAVLLALSALIRTPRPYILLVFGALVMYFALLTGPVSIARYRTPAEPYLFVLAAVGAYALAEKPRLRGFFRKKSVVMLGLGIFILVVEGFGILALINRDPNKLDSFAQCLTDRGARFYSAFWSPYSQAQKRMFRGSARTLPYIECSTPDGYGQLGVCKDKEIMQYSTWEFSDESRLTGHVLLMQLAEKTTCVLPK